MCSHCVIQISLSTEGSGHVAMWSLSQYGQSGLFSKHISRGKLQWDVSTSRVFVGLQTAVIHTVSWNCTLPLVTGLVNNVAVQLNAVARASTTSHHSASSHTTPYVTLCLKIAYCDGCYGNGCHYDNDDNVTGWAYRNNVVGRRAPRGFENAFWLCSLAEDKLQN